MKDPVRVLGRWRGFSLDVTASHRLSHATGACLPSVRAGTARSCQALSWKTFISERGATMPAWLEILLNVIGFAGFIGIAKYHKAPGGKLPDR